MQDKIRTNIVNKSLKYLRRTLTNQNCNHEEMKNRTSGNAYHHSIGILLSSFYLKLKRLRYKEV